MNDTVNERKSRELVVLRVSVVRAAQAHGVPLSIVGLQQDAEYAEIHYVAVHRDRGWNTLCAAIADKGERK